MKLSQMQKGQSAIIKEIDLPAELKSRFESMGLLKNNTIFICRVGFFGGSFYIKVAHESCIIVSKNEADHIEVELVEKGYRHRWRKNGFSEDCLACCQDEGKI